MMIVLDIAAMQPLGEFGERMERHIAELKSVPLAKDFDEVIYPSELEARNDATNRAARLVLPDDTIADLVATGSLHGVNAKPIWSAA